MRLLGGFIVAVGSCIAIGHAIHCRMTSGAMLGNYALVKEGAVPSHFESLASEEGCFKAKTKPVSMSPDMSPVQMVVHLNYKYSSKSEARVDFNVEVQGVDASTVFTYKDSSTPYSSGYAPKMHRSMGSSSPKGEKRVSHLGGNFDVPEAGEYEVVGEFEPHECTLNRAAVMLRRNVKPIDKRIVLLGVAVGAVGFVLMLLGGKGE